MTPTRTKELSLSEAAALVPDGAQLGMVGAVDAGPVAFCKELVRQQRRDLHLVLVPSGGFASDMLVGAGCAKFAEGGAMGWEGGTAPNFRRANQAGAIQPLDST